MSSTAWTGQPARGRKHRHQPRWPSTRLWTVLWTVLHGKPTLAAQGQRAIAVLGRLSSSVRTVGLAKAPTPASPEGRYEKASSGSSRRPIAGAAEGVVKRGDEPACRESVVGAHTGDGRGRTGRGVAARRGAVYSRLPHSLDDGPGWRATSPRGPAPRCEPTLRPIRRGQGAGGAPRRNRPAPWRVCAAAVAGRERSRRAEFGGKAIACYFVMLLDDALVMCPVAHPVEIARLKRSTVRAGTTQGPLPKRVQLSHIEPLPGEAAPNSTVSRQDSTRNGFGLHRVSAPTLVPARRSVRSARITQRSSTI